MKPELEIEMALSRTKSMRLRIVMWIGTKLFRVPIHVHQRYF